MIRIVQVWNSHPQPYFKPYFWHRTYHRSKFCSAENPTVEPPYLEIGHGQCRSPGHLRNQLATTADLTAGLFFEVGVASNHPIWNSYETWFLWSSVSSHPLSSLTLASRIRAAKRTVLEEMCVRLTYSYGREQMGICREIITNWITIKQLVGYIISKIYLEKAVMTGLRALTVWSVEFASAQLAKLVG